MGSKKGQWAGLCMCMYVYMSLPGTVTRLPVMGKALHVYGDSGVCVFSGIRQ